MGQKELDKYVLNDGLRELDFQVSRLEEKPFA